MHGLKSCGAAVRAIYAGAKANRSGLTYKVFGIRDMQAQLDKLSRVPAHTRFAADPYPESYIIRTGDAARETVAGEMHTA